MQKIERAIAANDIHALKAAMDKGKSVGLEVCTSAFVTETLLQLWSDRKHSSSTGFWHLILRAATRNMRPQSCNRPNRQGGTRRKVWRTVRFAEAFKDLRRLEAEEEVRAIEEAKRVCFCL